MSDFLSLVDPLSGSFATLVRLPKQLRAFGRSLSCDFGQVSNSYQVVGSGSELEDPTHQLQPSGNRSTGVRPSILQFSISI